MPLLHLTLGRTCPAGLPERLARRVSDALGVPADRTMVVAVQGLVHLGGIFPNAILAELVHDEAPSPPVARDLVAGLVADLAETCDTPAHRIFVRVSTEEISGFWTAPPSEAEA